MQNNLLFFGVHEVERNGDTKGLLREVLTNEITLAPGKRVEDLKFNVVHRLGRRRKAYERNNGDHIPRPRSIVAQFERFRDREIVRNAATTLTDTRISIREHFQFEIEERRKKLYPAMRKALKGDNKVRMVRDKLYINDALYDEADEKFANLRQLQNKNETRRNLDNPWNRQHVRPISNNRPSDRKFGQNNQYGSSKSTSRAYDMDYEEFALTHQISQMLTLQLPIRTKL